jgi:branched-chain amino acid transport system ATP-binding protein
MEPATTRPRSQESAIRQPRSAEEARVAPLRGRQDAAPAVLLEAHGLRKSFGGQVVLAGVDLQVRDGEVVLLHGANGSGKTTLLNMLTGNLEPDAGEIHVQTSAVSRRFLFPRPWWSAVPWGTHYSPERLAAAGVQRTWQDVRLFQSLRLRDNIAVAEPGQPGEKPWRALLRPGAITSWESGQAARVETSLEQLGLAGRGDSSADRISLGQSKRVAIARAVHSGARVLLLDEPLAGLDAAGVEEVLVLLANLARHRHVALVIVEHQANIGAVLRFATSVWTLAAGRLRIEEPAAACSDLDEVGPDDLRRWICARAGRPLDFRHEALPGGALLVTTRLAPLGDGEPRLELEGLSVRRGPRWIFGGPSAAGGLSLGIAAGDLAVLYAPNGWGKTTLLEALSGLVPIAGGSLKWAGEAIEGLTAWERERRGIVLLRSRARLFASLTVTEVIELAGATDRRAALADLSHKRVSALSGGERQRLALACVPAQAAVRLLDEPFSALDAAAAQETWRLVAPRPDSISLIALPSRHL